MPITISDCGVFGPLNNPGAGYWYDSPDAESFSGVSPIFMVLPRVAVLGPNSAVLEKFQKAMSEAAVVTCLSVEELSEESMQVARIQELLGTFGVDVVIVGSWVGFDVGGVVDGTMVGDLDGNELNVAIVGGCDGNEVKGVRQ